MDPTLVVVLQGWLPGGKSSWLKRDILIGKLYHWMVDNASCIHHGTGERWNFHFGFKNHNTFLIFQYYQICCDNLVARRILMESHLCYHLCQSCESWLISCYSHDDIINYSLSNCTPAKKGNVLCWCQKEAFERIIDLVAIAGLPLINDNSLIVSLW